MERLASEEILYHEHRLGLVQSEHGEESAETVAQLRQYAGFLRRAKIRLLDAANMEARAKVLEDSLNLLISSELPIVEQSPERSVHGRLRKTDPGVSQEIPAYKATSETRKTLEKRIVIALTIVACLVLFLLVYLLTR